MSKVTNVSGKTVYILRWKVLPDGRIISPMGALVSNLPDDVVYSPQAKHLADQKLITISGYSKAEKPPEKVPEEVEEQEEQEEPDEEDL